MCPRPNRQRQQGVGLVAAIFTITAVALLAVMVTRLVGSGAASTSRDLLSLKAFAAAESGAHIALNRLFAPVGTGACANLVLDLEPTGLTTCSATTTCATETVAADTWYSITSTGTCDTGSEITTRVVQVRANP